MLNEFSGTGKEIAQLDIKPGQLIFSRSHGICAYRRPIRRAANGRAQEIEVHLVYSLKGDDHFIVVSREDVTRPHDRATIIRAVDALRGIGSKQVLKSPEEVDQILLSGNIVAIAALAYSLRATIKNNSKTKTPSSLSQRLDQGLNLIASVFASFVVSQQQVGERKPSTILKFFHEARQRLDAILDVGDQLDDTFYRVLFKFRVREKITFDGKIAAAKKKVASSSIAIVEAPETEIFTAPCATTHITSSDLESPKLQPQAATVSPFAAIPPVLHIVPAIPTMNEGVTTPALRSPEEIYAELRAATEREILFLPREGPYDSVYRAHPWSKNAEGKRADPQTPKKPYLVLASKLVG